MVRSDLVLVKAFHGELNQLENTLIVTTKCDTFALADCLRLSAAHEAQVRALAQDRFSSCRVDVEDDSGVRDGVSLHLEVPMIKTSKDHNFIFARCDDRSIGAHTESASSD